MPVDKVRPRRGESDFIPHVQVRRPADNGVLGRTVPDRRQAQAVCVGVWRNPSQFPDDDIIPPAGRDDLRHLVPGHGQKLRHFFRRLF